MKKVSRISLLAALLLLFVGCSREVPMAPQKVSIPEIGTVQTGQIVIQFENELTDVENIKEKFPDLGIISAEPLFTPNPRFIERFKKSGLHLWYNVTFDKNVSMTKAHQDFSSIDGVKTVEFRPAIRPYQVLTNPFNDPNFSNQWHYHNEGKRSGFVAGMDMNLLKAWTIETGSEDVIVAIIDSGVDYNHPDLKDAMWVNEAEKNGTMGVDDDGNGYIDDIYGFNFCTVDGATPKGTIIPEDHGTHVAGTVAATNNNGLFGAGVAGGNGSDKKGARIMACQILEGNLPAFDGNALIYGADNGAVIAQNSWGYQDATYTPEYFLEAIDYFIEYAGCDENGNQVGPMKGGIVIFAAGNDNKAESYPPMEDRVLSVSSVGPDGVKAYYSNYGDWVDIAAPGGDQQAHGNMGGVYSTIPNGGFGSLQGTSMACPHVSGVAALIVSKHGGPDFTPDKLWHKLVTSASVEKLYDTNPGYVGKLGSGLLDAYAALYNESTELPGVVDDLNLVANSNTINLEWSATGTHTGDVAYSYNVYYSKNDLSDLDIDNIPEDVSKVNVLGAMVPLGDKVSTTISGLEFDTKYYFRVEALNISGMASDLSSQSSVTTGTNRPPVISIEGGITNFEVKSFESISRKVDIVDPDGHIFNASVETSTSAIKLEGKESPFTFRVNTPALNDGNYSVTIIATDEYGQESTLAINIKVLPNNPPVVTNQFPSLLIGKDEVKEIKLTDYFTDQDGEVLTYSLTSSSTATIVDASINGDILSIKGKWYGVTTVTVTAKDAKATTVSSSFDVLVRDSSVPFDLYPNPVVDVLNIRPGAESTLNVKITSVAGGIIYQNDGASCTPFAPFQIDATSWEPGTYMVEVKSANETVRKTIVKL